MYNKRSCCNEVDLLADCNNMLYWNGNTSRAGVANMRFDTFRVRDENKEKIKEKRHKGRK